MDAASGRRRSGAALRVDDALGRAFAREAGAALEHLSALDTVVDDLRVGRLGHLTLSYFASAGATWRPPVVATLTTEFPLLRLDLRLVELAAEKPFVPHVEVFVDTLPFAPIPGYDAQLLLTEPYVAVLPSGHQLADRDTIALRELRAERWVDNDVARGPCRQTVLEACAAAGFAPTFQVEAPDYPSALALVGGGVGITVLPRLAASVLGPGLRAVPVIEPMPERQVMIRIRRVVRGHPAVVRAVELLHDRAGMAQPALERMA